jgi:hypothetical protein
MILHLGPLSEDVTLSFVKLQGVPGADTYMYMYHTEAMLLCL